LSTEILLLLYVNFRLVYVPIFIIYLCSFIVERKLRTFFFFYLYVYVCVCVCGCFLYLFWYIKKSKFNLMIRYIALISLIDSRFHTFLILKISINEQLVRINWWFFSIIRLKCLLVPDRMNSTKLKIIIFFIHRNPFTRNTTSRKSIGLIVCKFCSLIHFFFCKIFFFFYLDNSRFWSWNSSFRISW